MKAWKVTFDNTGVITVFADNAAEAMRKGEEKALEHGWNLKAVKADQITR